MYEGRIFPKAVGAGCTGEIVPQQQRLIKCRLRLEHDALHEIHPRSRAFDLGPKHLRVLKGCQQQPDTLRNATAAQAVHNALAAQLDNPCGSLRLPRHPCCMGGSSSRAARAPVKRIPGCSLLSLSLHPSRTRVGADQEDRRHSTHSPLRDTDTPRAHMLGNHLRVPPQVEHYEIQAAVGEKRHVRPVKLVVT